MLELFSKTGERIEVLSNTKVRYIGTLSSYNESNQTITLTKVQSFGTEDRNAILSISSSTQVYEYIVFKIKNIERVRLLEETELERTKNPYHNKRVPDKRHKSHSNTYKNNTRYYLDINAEIPAEKYDFKKNNKKIKKPKNNQVLPSTQYDSSFFYDSLA
ncbi:hypothetical protein NEOKW01_0839 [Nematocida sp. AWRm80]|nr:hypothetical protein NEOKW01_0839 [Nematocida sp. AWRm80]